jgi:hypothetical protein
MSLLLLLYIVLICLLHHICSLTIPFLCDMRADIVGATAI